MKITSWTIHGRLRPRDLIQQAKHLLGAINRPPARRWQSPRAPFPTGSPPPDSGRIPAEAGGIVEQPSAASIRASPEAAPTLAPPSDVPNWPDIHHCGFWAESALCFNHLVSPAEGGRSGDDNVWHLHLEWSSRQPLHNLSALFAGTSHVRWKESSERRSASARRHDSRPSEELGLARTPVEGEPQWL